MVNNNIISENINEDKKLVTVSDNDDSDLDNSIKKTTNNQDINTNNKIQQPISNNNIKSSNRINNNSISENINTNKKLDKLSDNTALGLNESIKNITKNQSINTNKKMQTLSNNSNTDSNKSINNNSFIENINKDKKMVTVSDNDDSDLDNSIKNITNNRNINTNKKIPALSKSSDSDYDESINNSIQNKDQSKDSKINLMHIPKIIGENHGINMNIFEESEGTNKNKMIDLVSIENDVNKSDETEENYYKIKIPSNGKENASIADLQYDKDREIQLLNLIDEDEKQEAEEFVDNNINNNNDNNNNIQEEVIDENLEDGDNQEDEIEVEEEINGYLPNHDALKTDGDNVDNAQTIQKGKYFNNIIFNVGYNRRGAYLFYDDYESYIKEIFYLDGDEKDVAIHEKSTESYEQRIYEEMEKLDEESILKFKNIKGIDNSIWSIVKKRRVTSRNRKEYFRIQNYFLAKKINNLNAANRNGVLSTVKNGGDEFIYFSNVKDFVLNYKYTNPCEDWAILGAPLSKKEKKFIRFIQNEYEIVDEEESTIPIIIEFLFNEASRRDWTKGSFTLIKKRQPKSYFELVKHNNEKEKLKKEFKEFVLNN